MIVDSEDAQSLSHLEDSTSCHYCRYKLNTVVILYTCAYDVNLNGGMRSHLGPSFLIQS